MRKEGESRYARHRQKDDDGYLPSNDAWTRDHLPMTVWRGWGELLSRGQAASTTSHPRS